MKTERKHCRLKVQPEQRLGGSLSKDWDQKGMISSKGVLG